MATWITHLMIADKILEFCPQLDRRGFCVGNIAPDCNVENEDWTAFKPSRKITHWMKSNDKLISDCDDFCTEYILKRRENIQSHEKYSFLIGYYVHLLTDALFYQCLRDTKRLPHIWERIQAVDSLREQAKGYTQDWISLRNLVPKSERLRELYAMEAEYLQENPNSGYLTEILPLKEFPDYIDYLPHGSIVRKVGVMGYLPEVDKNLTNPIIMSREEFKTFVNETASYAINRLKELQLIK